MSSSSLLCRLVRYGHTRSHPIISRSSVLICFRSVANHQNNKNKGGGRFHSALLAALTTTKTLFKQAVSRILSPPEDAQVLKTGGHSIGSKVLAGSSILGLGGLCYYGILHHPDTIPSARNRHKLWPDHVRWRVRSAFGYLGLSAIVTAASTWTIFRSRAFMRLIHSAPWLIFASSLALQIGTGVVLLTSSYTRGSYVNMKEFTWLVHCSLLGITIAPMCYVGGFLVSRAFLMTGSIISALALLAYTAPESTFLLWSLPLGMGLGVVFAASTGSFLIPQSTRLGSSLFAVYLYGGMTLFGGMLLYDVQRVLQTAERLPFDPDRPDTFDPINAAMAMYMDCLNIFVRFVQLFALQEVAKRIKK